ncbi:MAG: hypothetical protein JST22_12475 [Bacteroidetes bacterium]|nr:hypothetical protein [Bacteroidota bacterium]
MTQLAALEERHVFPPRRFLVVIWIGTLLIAIIGLIATPGFTVKIYSWGVITVVALWQLWTLRWISVDRDGVTARNIFRYERAIGWNEIVAFQEQTVQLSKGTYTVLRLSKYESPGVTRTKTIALTNDQMNFTLLCDLVRASVPNNQ